MNENLEELIQTLLLSWGEDPHRDGLKDTPRRFLSAMQEMLSGYKESPADHLKREFEIEPTLGQAKYDQMIVSREIPFVSFCEHHLMPFFGEAHIGYLPKESRIVGLSKIARCLDGFARRLQVQERLTQQVLNAMVEVLDPTGAIVIIEGTHTCQCWRGVKKMGKMLTSGIYGVYREDASARAEALKLLGI